MVIDTMVFAYALLGVAEFRDEAAAVLDRTATIWVPDSLRAELVNVVWQWIQTRGLPLELGIEVLRDAEALFTQVVASKLLWERALVLAVQGHQSAYDTLFVALAEQRESKVVTYDVALRRAFSDRTISPTDFLASQS